jgi:hypothetical protein
MSAYQPLSSREGHADDMRERFYYPPSSSNYPPPPSSQEKYYTHRDTVAPPHHGEAIPKAQERFQNSRTPANKTPVTLPRLASASHEQNSATAIYPSPAVQLSVNPTTIPPPAPTVHQSEIVSLLANKHMTDHRVQECINRIQELEQKLRWSEWQFKQQEALAHSHRSAHVDPSGPPKVLPAVPVSPSAPDSYPNAGSLNIDAYMTTLGNIVIGLAILVIMMIVCMATIIQRAYAPK